MLYWPPVPNDPNDSLPAYAPILRQYQSWLAQHGDTNRGVGWPDQKKAEVLYRVMLDVMPVGQSTTLLDLGCGPGRMLDWLRRDPDFSRIQYTGVDFNNAALEIARRKYPDVPFRCCDLLRQPFEEHFDYVILNGVLTMKAGIAFEQMWAYAQRLLGRVWSLTGRAIAFNVMSKAVDWERDDLFHLPTDLLISFLTSAVSRRFVIRQDYAPYEYTVYVYR